MSSSGSDTSLSSFLLGGGRGRIVQPKEFVSFTQSSNGASTLSNGPGYLVVGFLLYACVWGCGGVW